MKTLIGAIALPSPFRRSRRLRRPLIPMPSTRTWITASITGKHDCKECCEKMKQQAGKMECMEEKGEAKTSSSAQQDQQGHDGHAH